MDKVTYSISNLSIFPGISDVYLTIHMRITLVTYDDIQCETLMMVDQPVVINLADADGTLSARHDAFGWDMDAI